MDNSFSLYRVGLLIKRQWASFGKIFLIALGAVTLIIIGFYLYNLPTEHNFSSLNLQKEGILYLIFPLPVFCITGILFVSLTANWYFNKWGKKANATEELLLPASNLEKTVSGILLTSVVGIGGFLIVFFLIDGAYRMYINDFVKTLDASIKVNSYSDNMYRARSLKDCHALPFIKDLGSKVFLLLVVIGLIIQSTFLLGSIYFKRFQYIKTLVTFLLTGFLSIFSGIKWHMYLTKRKVEVYHTLQKLDHKNDGFPNFFFIVLPILILIFYWVTYLRVKEKEV